MKYHDTINWMFSQLPMYQNQGASAYKVDLTNTIRLASHLQNPENKFKSIHVAGTNGKGSTSHMLASVLQTAGYKVGLYTSPHLKDFRERIRINGQKISEEYVVDFINQHKTYLENNHLSFFEMTVGLAFQYFAISEVDIAIIEVGLGGKLDSTNIITPEISVITNIGLDHTQFLGNTLSQIATEKAGIIKKNIPVVIGSTTPETARVFKEKSLALESDLYLAAQYKGVLFSTDLKGHYQKENVKTAVQVLSVLQENAWKIKDTDIQKGLQEVVVRTGLLGRWQILKERPKVICDTAHNAAGLRIVMAQLLEEKFDTLHIVLGVLKDKDLKTILSLFPAKARYYFSKPSTARGLDSVILKKEAKKHNLEGEKYTSVKEAYNTALQRATVRDLIYVGGSTFVVAEII